VSKGHALARLAAHLGVCREETIAIGDNDNDRSMIEWAGGGYGQRAGELEGHR